MWRGQCVYIPSPHSLYLSLSISGGHEGGRGDFPPAFKEGKGVEEGEDVLGPKSPKI